MTRQSGTSLLELLVAQALGLLLVAGLLQSLSDGLDQQRQHEDRLQLRESTQLIGLVLGQSLAASGYMDWGDRGWASATEATLWDASRHMPGGAGLFACPGDMQGTPAQHANASAADLPRCASVRRLRETLQVVHQGGSQSPDHTLTHHPASKDCLQQSSPGPWVVNRFYVRVGSLGAQLLCAGSGNHTGQALVAGVEELTFRFLVRHPNGHTQWFATADMGAADAEHWPRVVRLELCWVMASSASGRGGSPAHRQQNPRPTCQRDPDGRWSPGVARAPNDRRLWQRHTQTVALHNHHTGNAP